MKRRDKAACEIQNGIHCLGYSFRPMKSISAGLVPLFLLPEHDTVTNISNLNGILRGIKNTWQNEKSIELTRYRALRPNTTSIMKNQPTFSLSSKNTIVPLIKEWNSFTWFSCRYLRLLTKHFAVSVNQWCLFCCKIPVCNQRTMTNTTCLSWHCLLNSFHETANRIKEYTVFWLPFYMLLPWN